MKKISLNPLSIFGEFRVTILLFAGISIGLNPLSIFGEFRESICAERLHLTVLIPFRYSGSSENKNLDSVTGNGLNPLSIFGEFRAFWSKL